MLKKPTKSKGKSKRSKECDITDKVRQAVYERDKGICIICMNERGIPNMHYIPRSKGGLGIEQNIICGGLKCHHEYDNACKTKERKNELKSIITGYLKSKYEEWNEEELIYKK